MHSQSNTSPRENSHSPHSQPYQLQNLHHTPDEHSQEIRAILQSGRPLFVVEVNHGSINRTQSQQEIIKRKILSYNRREKSLEQLSRRFVQNFEQGKEVLLQLDKVMTQLKVERRRIYDIVNIFQSLQVIRKASKNNYIWRGLKEAVRTINNVSSSNEIVLSDHSSKHKSLENLASRFLHIFVTYSSPITLEEAAKLLISTEDCSLVRTKLRRLYDIINVFKSIGLVQKVTIASRKTAFRWMGTCQLERIISNKIGGSKDMSERQEVEKQNMPALNNFKSVNEWFCEEELRAFATLNFMKQYSQRIFLPSIIMQMGPIQSVPVYQPAFE